jgi:GT2 family glycosyltransferase
VTSATATSASAASDILTSVDDQKAPEVSVILVNWNGWSHLERCLPALLAQEGPSFEVLVADNGSSDGSQAHLKERWPNVRLLELGDNLGFAEANNRAIRESHTPWVVLLNNDTEPRPGWLAALVQRVASDPAIASVASLMLFMDRPEMVNSAGIALDETGIAWDLLGGAKAEEAQRELKVFGPSAGAALYRREALDEVAMPDARGLPAYFDPDFFMYLEDVDLAWRLRLAGWKAAYEPRAQVLHAGSASSGEGSSFKNRLLARNKVWTLLKNYPTWPLLARLPLVLAYDLGSAPYRLLVQGQSAAFSGRIDALRGIAGALRKRKQIQAQRKATWPELRDSMRRLEPPWAVLRRYRHLKREEEKAE